MHDDKETISDWSYEAAQINVMEIQKSPKRGGECGTHQNDHIPFVFKRKMFTAFFV